jgi:hypothetical protein
MFTRAWLRGFLLAGIQLLALLYLGTAPDFAAVLLIGVRIYDPAGAIWRIWAGTPPDEPRARRDHGIGRHGPPYAAAAAPLKVAPVAGDEHERGTPPIRDPGPT